MGFLSSLFGGNKEEKALREALSHIQRILDDEKFQLELVHPAMKAMLESAPAYDQDPRGSGPFGFAETNPIPVNGPIGQLAYLSRLETQAGQRIHACVGALGVRPESYGFELLLLTFSREFIREGVGRCLTLAFTKVPACTAMRHRMNCG